MKRNQRFVCFILAFLLVLSTTSNVFAKNTRLIDQVKNEYVNYEKKTTSTYETYQQKTVKEYEQYREKQLKSFDRFSKQTDQDIMQLERLLNEDFRRLKEQYGDNQTYSTKLRNYENQINSNYLGSSMQKYSQSINPNYLNSKMSQLKNVVNENYLNSPMSKYKNTVNQHYLNSPMSKYKNAANQHYLNSPMSRLKNGNNEYYLNSIMAQYKQGKLTQSTAVKQWNTLLKKEGQNLQSISKKTNGDINYVKDTTDDAILTQQSKTVNGILEQRTLSLQTIANLRNETFGETIHFDPLIPDLEGINVIVLGEWLALKQSPVLSNGAPLVPLRPVFEKLDSALKITKKGNVITISKPNVNITITLNKKTATVNGKAFTLEVAPKLVNGQTMIPPQLVSESFGNDVHWDSNNHTVFIK